MTYEEKLVAVVLVLCTRGLGNLLTAVPALRALRRARPHDHIVLATPPRLQPIVDLVACTDAVMPLADPADLRWGGAAPDLAVNVNGPDASSILELARARPQQLLTYGNPALPHVSGLPWRDDVHLVDRWCHLLESGGILADRRNLGLLPPVAATSHRGCVAVHVGASAAARRWPAQRFAAVVRHLLARGHEVVLTGDDSERAIAMTAAVAAGLPRQQVLAGRQTLTELAATIAEATVVVCGDTGVAHLATAFGTRTVLLFGPSAPSHRGPPPHLARRHIVLWSGRTGDPEATNVDPGLADITVEQVVAALDRQLHRPRRGSDVAISTAGRVTATIRQDDALECRG